MLARLELLEAVARLGPDHLEILLELVEREIERHRRRDRELRDLLGEEEL